MPSTENSIVVRRAVAVDAPGTAGVFVAALGAMPFMPRLYSEPQERDFIEQVILPTTEVWVAAAGPDVVSFLALDRNEIRLLFTHPAHQGKGAGGALIRQAKALGRSYLDLWCFEVNEGAQRFYEREGFRMVEWTDGLRNEEKLPDRRYFWQPPPAGL